MKIKINDNQYIMPKNAIDSIINKFEKIETKRLKLIEKGRIPADFPEIKVEFKNINKELENELLAGKELSVTKKKLLQHGIKERSLYDVSINTNSLPILNDWRILGSINKNLEKDTYTMDSYSPKDHPIPIKYRDTDPCNCDHCGHNRKRNSTFIIENQKTDELMQVGSSCMDDFVDNDTMEMLLLFSHSINVLRNFDPDMGVSGGNHHFMLDKIEFLAHINAAMEASNGFVAKKKANYYASIIPTYSAALHKMESVYLNAHISNLERYGDYSRIEIDNYESFIKELNPTQKDYDKVNEVIDWYTNNPPREENDESYFNTHSILTNKSAMLFNGESGAVCYSIQQIDNIKLKADLAKLQETIDKNKLDIPVFFGHTGNKIESIELQLTNITATQNEWGEFANYYFKTRDGREFQWQASNMKRPDCFNEIDDIEGFEKLKAYIDKANREKNEVWLQMKGTVKHNEYTRSDGVEVKNTKITHANSVSDIYDKPMTSGTPTLSTKYKMNEFKIISVKSGLASQTMEKQQQYTLQDSNGVDYLYLPFKKLPNLKVGDFFQTPMQFAGKEVIGLNQAKILKIEDFTEDFEKVEITKNKMLKFNTVKKSKPTR